MKSWVSILLTVVLFAVGWFVARPANGPTGPLVVKPENAIPSTATAVPETATSEPEAGSMADRMENLLARARGMSSVTETTMQLFEFAARLRPEEMPAAITAAMQSTHEGGLGSAQMLAAYWAERDLGAARQWLSNLPWNSQRTFIESIGSPWANQNASGFLDWFEAMPAEQRTQLGPSMTITIAATAGEAEPARVAKLLLSLPRSNDTRDFTRLFRGWASMDAGVAAKYAMAMPSGAARSAAIEAVGREWARRDPVGARAWAQSLPDAVLATRVMPSIAFGLAEKDPKAAAEYVQQTPGAADNESIIKRVAASWADRDPELALQWADTLGTPEAQRWAALAALDKLAARNPKRAAAAYIERVATLDTENEEMQFNPYGQSQGAAGIANGLLAKEGMDAVVKFTQQLPKESGQAALLSAIAQWSTSDADGLAAWAAKQPESDQRTAALGIAAQSLATRDPRAAVEWARNLPSGESRDAALGISAGALLQVDTAAAEQVLRSIPSAMAQEGAMSAATMWMFEDPVKARAWIEKTSLLGDEQRRSLLEMNIPRISR